MFLATVLVGFPTSRQSTRQEAYTDYETVPKTDIIKTVDCNRTLTEDQILQVNWNFSGPQNTRTLGVIRSTANITIKLATAIGNNFRDNETYYNYTSNFHNITFFYGSSADEKVNYLLTFKNQNSSSVIMNGSVVGYRSYNTQVPVTKYRMVNYQQWLPWWMP